MRWRADLQLDEGVAHAAISTERPEQQLQAWAGDGDELQMMKRSDG